MAKTIFWGKSASKGKAPKAPKAPSVKAVLNKDPMVFGGQRVSTLQANVANDNSGSDNSGDYSSDDSGAADDAQLQAQEEAQVAAYVYAQVQRLNQGYANSGAAINQADTDLRARFASLQSQQQAATAANVAQVGADNTAQQAGYTAAVQPISHDLEAQGFSAAPVAQQQAADQARMADFANSQTTFNKNLQAVQDRSFADRTASADMMHSGAQTALQATYLQAMAALTDGSGGGSSGGGGGGGGGSGGGGGGGSGVLTAGDSAQVGNLATPLTDVTTGAGASVRDQATQDLLDAYLHGGQGYGHVSGGGAHAAKLATKYQNAYDHLVDAKKIKSSPAQRKQFQKALRYELKQVQSNAKTRSKDHQKRHKAKAYLQARQVVN